MLFITIDQKSTIIMRKVSVSPELAARFASIVNVGLAIGKLSVGFISNNVGFITDSVHDAADAAAYSVKGKALNTTNNRIARRLQHFGASVLTLGGTYGIAVAGYQMHNNDFETANNTTITIAWIAAAMNSLAAYIAHCSEDDELHSVHKTEHTAHQTHREVAHKHTVHHTMVDVLSGLSYAIGLSLEHTYQGSANWAIALGGAVNVIAGLRMHSDIERTHKHILRHS